MRGKGEGDVRVGERGLGNELEERDDAEFGGGGVGRWR